MNGLFLQGGGAKGAFQAGAIKALYEAGIRPSIVSGTSIGAINGYFLMTGNVDELEILWNSVEDVEFREPESGENVIPNDSLIGLLEKLKIEDSSVKSMYVNYVSVNKSRPTEVIKNLSLLDREEALQSIRYSSLLPFIEEASRDTAEIMEKFKKKLSEGFYDGYNLDGGILNNDFTQPLEDKEVDEIYLIGLSQSYQAGKGLLKKYDSGDIKVIRPEIELSSTDTLRFEGDFCRYLYQEGYNSAKKIL